MISIFTVSCVEPPDNETIDQPTGYDLSKQIDVGPFTFNVVADMAEVEVQPIDSLVKKYENSEMELALGYGWYSGYSPYETEETITIDGFDAIYHTRDGYTGSGYKYHSIVHFERVNDSEPASRLSMYINSNREDASDIALAIFKTIDFK